jgi:hypothetical protein
VVYVHKNYLIDKPDWKSLKQRNTLWGDATTLIWLPHIDDLAIAMKNPKVLSEILERRHKFKLKGTGPISFTLGWILPGMMIIPCASH